MKGLGWTQAAQRRLSPQLVAWIVLCGLGPGAAFAALDGFIDLRAVQSETGAIAQNSLRQEYTIAWSRAFVPYVSARAALRYFNFDVDRVELSNTLEELQPSGELVWSHPLFNASASGFRRSSRSQLFPGKLITDNAVLAYTSRNWSWPILSARYESQHNFNTTLTSSARDTRDRRLRIGADYSVRAHSLSYSYTRRLGENIISDLSSRQNSHLLRWAGSGSPLESGRLRLATNYRISYDSRTDEALTDSGVILEDIPVATGLFAVDGSPEVGRLAAVPGLTDGNTTSATEPPIDIGAASIDVNIGADLGFSRSVVTLYVYVDRTSDPLIDWRVYVSNDNLSWQLWDASPTAAFNSALSRYEIGFIPVATRYVKVIKVGLNAVSPVFVTEIEALQEVSRGNGISRSVVLNLLDARVGYAVTRDLDTALDFTIQSEALSDTLEDRFVFDYTWSGRYSQTRFISHQARWEQSFQRFNRDSEDRSNDNLSYTLIVTPLPTIAATFSLNNRRSFIEDFQDAELNTALLELRGAPAPGANIALETSRTHGREFLGGSDNLTWTYRASIDGSFTRSLDGIVSYLHQRTRTALEGVIVRKRDLYTLGFDYRVTRTIFGRGSIDINSDAGTSIRQSYLLSWNIVPKANLAARAIINELDGDFRTDQYSVNLSYNMNRRTTLYFNYALTDFTEAGGFRSISLQQGLRTSF